MRNSGLGWGSRIGRNTAPPETDLDIPDGIGGDATAATRAGRWTAFGPLGPTSILVKKRQTIVGYDVAVAGEQRDDPHPHVYQRIDIVHELVGADLDVAAVRPAIELSATRYCTASAMFSAGPAEIHDRYIIRRCDGRPDEEGEVVVTGPSADPDALGEPRPSMLAGAPA